MQLSGDGFALERDDGGVWFDAGYVAEPVDRLRDRNFGDPEPSLGFEVRPHVDDVVVLVVAPRASFLDCYGVVGANRCLHPARTFLHREDDPVSRLLVTLQNITHNAHAAG